MPGLAGLATPGRLQQVGGESSGVGNGGGSNQ